MWPARLAAIRAEHGPEAIAFYLSGQLLTEDYYVANKLAKGFIGTPHVDTNSRLCMASSVAGHRRAFGADVVPQCYDDLELADLVVLAGSNAAWCHPDPLPAHPDGARRARRARRQHRSAPHRHLRRRRPASVHQARHRRLSVERAAGVAGRAPADRRDVHRARTRAASPGRCGAPAARAHPRCRRRRDRPRSPGHRASSTTGSPARRASSPATARASTSRRRAPTRSTPSSTAIWRPGASASRAPARSRSPASPTPWAGARSAASPTCWPRTWASPTAERDRVRRFWNAPNLVDRPGPQGRRHVRRGRRRPHQGAVGDGHQSGGVAAARRRGARRRWPSSTCWSCPRTSPATTRLRIAHVRLPAAAWGEKDGTVTNSERCISRQRAFLPLPGERAARLVDPERGGAAAGLRRGVRLPLVGRDFRRARAPLRLRERGQARLRHFRRRGPRAERPSTGWSRSSGRFAAATRRRRACSPTAASSPQDRKARFVAIAPPRLSAAVSDDWPFVLNTGRVRDQWHTMTRTGLSPRLSTHIAEPFVEIHPDDAARLRLEQGTLAQRRDGARLRQSCASSSTADSSRARCSCRCTGRPRTAPRAASARWCSRRPIRSPASPRPRRRRRASRRCPWRTTASCCRASRCSPPALTYWARGTRDLRAHPQLRAGRAADGLERVAARDPAGRRYA